MYLKLQALAGILRGHFLTIAAILAVFSVFPHFAFAAPIVQNTSATTTLSQGTAGNAWEYYIGTGLSGSPASITIGPLDCDGFGCAFVSAISLQVDVYCFTTPPPWSHNAAGTCTDFGPSGTGGLISTSTPGTLPGGMGSGHLGTTTLTFSGSYIGNNINPAEYYRLRITPNHDITIHGGYFSTSGGNAPAFDLDDSGGSSTQTIISATVPVSGSTSATSTTFTIGASGYVNAADYASGLVLRMEISYNYATGYNPSTGSPLIQPPGCPNNWAQSLANILGQSSPAIFCQWPRNGPTAAKEDFPISAAGTFSVSTSTPILNTGRYAMTYSLIKPLFSFLGVNVGETTLTATTTNFIAVQKSYYDTAQDQVNDIIGIVNATSSAAVLAKCNPVGGSFDIGVCAYGLIVPNSSDMETLWNNFQTFVLAKFPWGYATRMVQILNTATSSAPGPIVFNFPSTTFLAGSSWTIDPFGSLAEGAAITGAWTNPDTGDNLRTITEPFMRFFLALSIVIIIFHDIMAMGHSRMPRPRGRHA